MAPKNLSVKLRPLRIGFLLRAGCIEDIVRAAELNTLLYGGMYNPILPVGDDNRLTDLTLALFNVDVLLALEESPEIDKFKERYPYLRDPYHMPLFYGDSQTTKKSLSYLDCTKIMYGISQKQSRLGQHSLLSDFVLPTWTTDDPASDLFSIYFGRFPDSHNLKEDFRAWYRAATCPQMLGSRS
ncbi:MAG: hypothetical protein ACREDR_10500 [Blastocatellia bacterium]